MRVILEEKRKAGKRGRGAVGKIPVFGLLNAMGRFIQKY